MSSPTNLRKSLRFPLVAPVQVFWTDAEGIESQRNGYAIDTSSGGLKMKLPSPLPVNSSITVRVARLNFVGSASVRHCRREGRRYLVGVSFQPLSSEVAQSEPPPPERVQDGIPDEAAESRFLLDEPVTDDVRLFFQDRKERRRKRVVAEKFRHKVWLRVALAVWVAVVVLFIVDLPLLLRYVSVTFQHPLLERASAFVETIVK